MPWDDGAPFSMQVFGLFGNQFTQFKISGGNFLTFKLLAKWGHPNGGIGCCPYKDGICCKDGHHCCPSGTHCDLDHMRCIRSDVSFIEDIF